MLKTELSCEVEDLMREIKAKTGKSYDEIESSLMEVGKYPESKKTYITTKFGPIVKRDSGGKYNWLEKALQEIFEDLNNNSVLKTEICGMYITLAI